MTNQDIHATVIKGVTTTTTTIDANQITVIGTIGNELIRAEDQIRMEVVDQVHMVAIEADVHLALDGEVTEVTHKAAVDGIRLHNEIRETTHTDELQVHPRGTVTRREHHHPRVVKAVCA